MLWRTGVPDTCFIRSGCYFANRELCKNLCNIRWGVHTDVIDIGVEIRQCQARQIRYSWGHYRNHRSLRDHVCSAKITVPVLFCNETNTVTMYKFFLISFLLTHILSTATAQLYPDSATFIVHRHLKPIGFESYHLVHDNVGYKTFLIDCSYSDRGVLVPLKTLVILDSVSELRVFETKGSTSRMSKISDTVRITSDSIFTTRDSITSRKNSRPNSFPVDGYAPATIQWLLIKTRERMGKPDTIFGFHGEPVQIRKLGTDTLGKGRSVMTAYGIRNVIWGWEFLWLDALGQLAALTTINAEGDKIEFILDKYESLLTTFSRRSAYYGVAAYPLKKQQTKDIAIIHAVLIDIYTGREFPDQTLLIKNGKIYSKGSLVNIIMPSGSTIIDAAGRYMLPGLWDMHAHPLPTQEETS